MKESLPPRLTVPLTGIKTKIGSMLATTGETPEEYVLRLLRCDLGVPTVSQRDLDATAESTRKEVWRDVAGFDGNYEVSSRGRVRRTSSETVIAAQFIRRRVVVHLQLNKKTKTVYVRRLVAEAFLGPIPKGYWVMHADQNPENLKVKNLLVVSPSEGARLAAEMTTKRARKSQKKKRSKS